MNDCVSTERYFSYSYVFFLKGMNFFSKRNFFRPKVRWVMVKLIFLGWEGWETLWE